MRDPGMERDAKEAYFPVDAPKRGIHSNDQCSRGGCLEDPNVVLELQINWNGLAIRNGANRGAGLTESYSVVLAQVVSD